MAKRASKKAFTPGDVRRIRFVSDPKVHPRSDQIAYVVRWVDEDGEKNRYRARIDVASPAGRGRRTLTAAERDADSPLWSPDGRWLLFASKPEEKAKKQLYLLPLDGGEARRLTSVEGGVTAAEWSPDSKWIAFRAGVDPRNSERKGKSGTKPFASDVQVVEHALWRLNGVGSWLDKRQHLFVVPVEGGEPRQLTEGPWNVGGPFPVSEALAFAPDGKRIFYLASPEPEDDWAAARRVDIHVVNRDGTRRRRVTDFPGMFFAVTPTARGELLAIGNDFEHGTASPNRLWRVDPESGRVGRVPIEMDLSLGDAVNCDVRFPSKLHDPWVSPDGARARARVTDRSAVRLAEVELDSGAVTWLTPEDLSVLAWHASPDGELRAEVRSSETELPEIWSVRGDGTPAAVTRLNDRLLTQRKVYPASPMPYEASDGVQVEAWVQQPPGRPKGGRPLVLVIHGGPKTVYGHAFLLEFQMLAGAGMAVLYANPRGSDGYGTAWAEAVHGHYGERDYEDLMDCVDHALAPDDGFDPQRLGVSGGSYGGFMTNWIIGHTDRFRAAVSQRSISNWFSFYGSSDIGYFFTPEHAGGVPWADVEQYREKSPITYVEEMHTPLLLIHSEQDLRCPIEQAEQLFIYLRRLGREVRFARFPEESHELSRSGSPNRRMERLRLILEWFQEKLL